MFRFECSRVKYKCRFPGCRNSYKYPPENGRDNKRFHQFPKDRETRLAWLEICGIPLDKEDSSNLRICEDHFGSHDYISGSRLKYLVMPKDASTVKPFKRAPVQPRYCKNEKETSVKDEVIICPLSMETTYTQEKYDGTSRSDKMNLKSPELILHDHDYFQLSTDRATNLDHNYHKNIGGEIPRSCTMIEMKKVSSYQVAVYMIQKQDR